MKRLIILLVLVLFLAGCATVSIQDIKSSPEQYIGEKINVKGIASDSLKIGKLSGFKLSESGQYILVSSTTLPEDETEVTVRGTVMKDTILGMYILADSVN